MKKRLRKEGNMHRLTYQAKSLPLQREFGRVALHSVHSNGPTDPYIYMYPAFVLFGRYFTIPLSLDI